MASVQFYATALDGESVLGFVNDDDELAVLVEVEPLIWKAVSSIPSLTSGHSYYIWIRGSGPLPLYNGATGAKLTWVEDPFQPFAIKRRNPVDTSVAHSEDSLMSPYFGAGFPGIFTLKFDCPNLDKRVLERSAFGAILNRYRERWILDGYRDTGEPNRAWQRVRRWFLKNSVMAPFIGGLANSDSSFRIFPDADRLAREGFEVSMRRVAKTSWR